MSFKKIKNEISIIFLIGIIFSIMGIFMFINYSKKSSISKSILNGKENTSNIKKDEKKIILVDTMTVKNQKYNPFLNASGYLSRDQVKIIPNASLHQNQIEKIISNKITKVKKGDFLIQYNVNFSILKLDNLKTKLEVAQRQHDRYLQLHRNGSLSANDLDKSQMDLNNILSEIKIEEFIIAQAKIVAPFDCLVLHNGYVDGSYCENNKEILTIFNISNIKINSKIFISDLPEDSYKQNIILNQEVQIPIGNKDLIGHISYVAPGSDPSIGALDIIITLDEENNNQILDLPNGYLCNMKILNGKELNVVSIPEESILGDESEYYVYVIRKNKAIKMPIKKVGYENNMILIEGLDDKQIIVISGVSKLMNGDSVKILHSGA
jgi:membrane fusion protein (multidrug efflux system)